MNLSQETSYLLIGAFIGFSSSGIGALVDFLIARRNRNQDKEKLPGCILLVTGSLGFLGLLVTVTSFFLSGGLQLALLSGLGVLGGFTITFMILTLGWLLLADRSPSPELFPKEQSQKKPDFKRNRA